MYILILPRHEAKRASSCLSEAQAGLHMLGSDRDEILKAAVCRSIMMVRKRARGGGPTEQIRQKNDALRQSGRSFEELSGHSRQDMAELLDPLLPQDIDGGLSVVLRNIQQQHSLSLPFQLPDVLQQAVQKAVVGGSSACT